jgi:hypothetical protein
MAGWYRVNVFVAEEQVREYAVEADSEEEAVERATEAVRDVVGGEAHTMSTHEFEEMDALDYDDVLPKVVKA